MRPGCAVARAAERLVGCPFRLHGRTREAGLDCVGLVLSSLAAAGAIGGEAPSYGLRNLSIARHIAFAAQVGLGDASGSLAPGDVLLFRLSGAQFHLGIVVANGGLVHAHAGLRRVVLTPLLPVWPIERHWRLKAS